MLSRREEEGEFADIAEMPILQAGSVSGTEQKIKQKIKQKRKQKIKQKGKAEK